MMHRHFVLLLLSLLFSGLSFAQPVVRVRTNMGDIDIQLLPASAPRTVDNFLKYVNRGAYNNSFFHRLVAGFVLQGGGFTFANGAPAPIAEDPPVVNEYRLSNTRGTIAMAKLGSGPNTATNQWFFNLADNSSNLNNQNGGFTVFGRVTNSAGLAVMDAMARVPVYNAGSPFDQLPLRNYTTGNVTAANLILINSIDVLGAAPAIREGGVISASNFGGMSFATPGSYIEIYGSDLAEATRPWGGDDFTSGKAPTTLEGATVTVNGQSAFVSYVSPTQINVQVPANVPAGGSVPVIVRYNGQSSATVQLPIRTTAGGLLAPASFRVEDRQYVAALHADGTFVSNGKVPNVAAAPAKQGETLLFYGIGFGPVTPSTIPVAGQIATELTTVTNQVQFKFGDAVAQVTYAGLAPNYVGLYQFNVVVPAGVSGDVPLQVTVADQPISQTLFVPVQAQ